MLFAPAPASETDTSLWKAFREFDERNPHIWEEFEKQTMKAIDKGFSKLGVSLIIERLRWETFLPTKEAEFKICNNHRAYYARKFMLIHPEHGNLFEIRKVRSN